MCPCICYCDICVLFLQKIVYPPLQMLQLLVCFKPRKSLNQPESHTRAKCLPVIARTLFPLCTSVKQGMTVWSVLVGLHSQTHCISLGVSKFMNDILVYISLGVSKFMDDRLAYISLGVSKFMNDILANISLGVSKYMDDILLTPW